VEKETFETEVANALRNLETTERDAIEGISKPKEYGSEKEGESWDDTTPANK